MDIAEQLAIDRVKELFGAEYANVQPHSGAQANAAALSAMIKPGDKILGLSLAHGGHLTHGMKLNFSGKLYDVAAYQVEEDNFRIDMDKLREQAIAEKPQVIIAGWSAYPRHLDFAAFRSIADEVGALLWTDMAHFAGLVAAGLHPSPVPHSDVVTSTVHKTLARPALRRDPGQAGVGQEDQLQRLPGPAGRPADARHRRQGRGVQDRRHARSSRSARSASWKAPRSSPTA